MSQINNKLKKLKEKLESRKEEIAEDFFANVDNWSIFEKSENKGRLLELNDIIDELEELLK